MSSQVIQRMFGRGLGWAASAPANNVTMAMVRSMAIIRGMIDPKTALLTKILGRVVAAPGASTWIDARKALAATGEPDEELAAAIKGQDVAALRAIVDGWASGSRPLPEQDKAVFKRAMKAFRKRLKLTRLDAESSLGGGPMSSGRSSGIVGIRAPDQYPVEVWDALVEQGRLVDAGQGMYELPPE